jgi:hypothetical protein
MNLKEDRKNCIKRSFTSRFHRVLTMAYSMQSYWVLGLVPSSGVFGNRNTTFRNWIYFLPQVKWREDTYSVGHIRKSYSLISD